MALKYRILLSVVIFLAVFFLASCSDDLMTENTSSTIDLDESDIIDLNLSLSINNFEVSSNVSTREEEPSDETELMSDFEKVVDNIWVFQYDENGEKLLIKPRYYSTKISVEGSTSLWNVQLKPNVSSKIYVVANVAEGESWANEYINFATVTQLENSVLPSPYTIYNLSEDAVEGHIPAQGYVENTTITSATSEVEVPVEHMYAKIKVRAIIDKSIKEYLPSVGYVIIKNCPWYCRIGTLYNGTPGTSQDNQYPTSIKWDEASLGSGGEGNNLDDPNNLELGDSTYDYVVYIPENIQGEHNANNEDDTKDAIGEAIEHASFIELGLNYTSSRGVEARTTYIAYPGGNTSNNFNIRRNQVYRVTMRLGYPLEEEVTPSANCIIGHPGTTISFEPYYRVETGGGFSFNQYLDPDNKQIMGLKILWQTQNCIGDNSLGDKVVFELNEEDPLHSKIYVTTNAPGNAVIAAYDEDPYENESANILWSWHIWVTEEDPANIGNAVVYYTYEWDETTIYGMDSGKNRVPGYGVMPCNLGALTSVPNSTSNADRVETYGLMYQWGRKDPFPALKKYAALGTNIEYGHYNDDTADDIYDNSHQTVHITDQEDESYLFHPISGTNIVNNNYGIDYTILHPTVFMCGTTLAGVSATESSSSNVGSEGKYHNTGDWLPKGQTNDRLWGASEVTDQTMSLYVGTDNYSSDRYLRDDYGEKSIFDPCPYGWRVSPPDQWLGFTDTGFNPITSMDEVNYNPSTSGSSYGMYLYIQGWRSGITSFFPCQGMISPDGGGSHNRSCGNYHNATADTDNRVNILHIHNSINNFRIFEIRYYNYYVKSVAGPVRCVRDTK